MDSTKNICQICNALTEGQKYQVVANAHMAIYPKLYIKIEILISKPYLPLFYTKRGLSLTL